MSNKSSLGIVYAYLLFAGLTFGLSYFVTKPPPLAWSVLLANFLIALIAFDIKTYRLPNFLTLTLAPLGVFYVALTGQSVISSITGGALAYGLLWGVAAYWRYFKGYEGLGLGDAKLLCASGCWLGLHSVPIVLLVASLLGIVHFLMVGGKDSELIASKLVIPFGPSIALSFWSVWFLTSGKLNIQLF